MSLLHPYLIGVDYIHASEQVRINLVLRVWAVDMVVAFWDGSSKGTASSLKFAKLKVIPIQTIIF